MKEILVDKKTFCRVLGQLRRADIRKQDWALERMIESLEQCASPFRFYPYHDAVGMEDVLKRFSLLKELRIRGYVELGGLPAWRINKLRKPSHCLLNPLSRDRRHGALLYNQLVSVQVARDDPGYGFYLAQIGFARLFLRGADADKQDLRQCARPPRRNGSGSVDRSPGRGRADRPSPAHRRGPGLTGSPPWTHLHRPQLPHQPISTKPRTVGRPTCPRPSTPMRGLSKLD